MSAKGRNENSVSIPEPLKSGNSDESINVGGIEIAWRADAGTCDFRGIPVAMMWVDSTLAGLMSGVAAMVGPERFNLALQSEGRKSIESDWILIKSFPDFKDGFAQLNLNARVAGWGDWQLAGFDLQKRECVFRAYNNWEGGYQKALGVCWGSGMLAGKFAGICSKLFETNCWATQTRFVAKGDAFDEFVVAPSDRNLEREIEGLLASDSATRADMAVALKKLQDTEKILRESKLQYDKLVQNIPDGVYVIRHASGKAASFDYVSPRFCEILGFSAEQVLREAQIAFDAIHPDDRAEFDNANRSAIDSRRPFRWEGRFLVSGEVKWVRLASDPTPHAGGESVWHGVLSDVTDKRMAEASLQDLAQDLEATLRAIPDLLFELDEEGGFLKVWAHNKELLFVPEEQMIGRSYSEILPPQAAEEIHSSIVEAKRAGHSRGRVIELEFPDGVRWFELSVAFKAASSAHGAQYVVLSRDITSRKQMEDELRLAASIYQNSSEGMLVTDADNVIIAVNPAFTRLTGYTRDDVVGKSPKILQSGLQSKDFYRELWARLTTEGHWEGEIWNRHKLGYNFAEQLSIRVVKNDDGTIHRFIAQFSDITEKKRKEEQIWQHANYDNLTGLPNRRLFMDRLGIEIKKGKRGSEKLALLFIDLDRFKEINDTLGHVKGDILLREAAGRIRSCLRESDTVARLGGDEFTTIIADYTDQTAIEQVAKRILKALSLGFDLGGDDFAYISASIGIAIFPTDATDVDTLMKHADQSMYAAKAQGRNQFSFFTPSMQEAAEEKLRLTIDLRVAMVNHEFELHYQPIVDLADGSISKAEALLRWKHPERGMVSPGVFIPLAEESGLIHELGDWVFQEAISDLAFWQKKFGRHIEISVNKSPNQFSRAGNSQWLEKLAESGLPPGSLVAEITEGTLLKESAVVKQRLATLKEKGVRVALDDFGTGYSALSYLHQYEVDYVKIDRSFISGMTTSEKNQALVEAIIAMAHKLGVKTVAEGVETQAHHEVLVRLGCDFAQGYLYSKPLPKKDFELLLQPLALKKAS